MGFMNEWMNEQCIRLCYNAMVACMVNVGCMNIVSTFSNNQAIGTSINSVQS